MAWRDKSLLCSFCGKDQSKVKKLIAGPTVYICNECVDLCVGIICEDAELKGEPLEEFLPVTAGKQNLPTSTSRPH